MASDKTESGIHAAIEQLDTERLRVLLSRGVDVEEKDAYGTTPLVRAVEEDSLEIVESLLNAGADVNAPSSVGFEEEMLFRVSLQNALSYAIVRFVVMRRFELTPVRYQIIKRLIAAGSDLDVAEQYQDRYISTLQNACSAKLWPVIVDLVEAGSKVDVKGRRVEMPLVTAASVTGRRICESFNPFRFDVKSEDDDCPVNWPSRKKALALLIERSPNLRIENDSKSLFSHVIEGCSAGALCMLLKADKPAYGIDEAADELDFEDEGSIISSAIHVTLDYDLLPSDRLYSPLEISVVDLFEGIHYPYWNDQIKLWYIRRQFAILRLLLDARVPVCNLDENFKQFLRIIRDRLNADYNNHRQGTLEYCNQVLNEIESRVDTPRNLREMCRTRVRYELNIRGLCVHHIKDNISHIVRDYLLYGDVPEPEAYLVYDEEDE